jgi:hypothetical protein
VPQDRLLDLEHVPVDSRLHDCNIVADDRVKQLSLVRGSALHLSGLQGELLAQE